MISRNLFFVKKNLLIQFLLSRPAIVNKMKTKYINNPDYSYDKVNRASAACGPLVKWATAQLTYADMLSKVEPLRNELKKLETEAEKKVADMQQTNDLISTL
jgi:dynein heavy chain 1